ncbi:MULTISPECIES: DUF6153 family protein [Pseudonocardia]|uniref:Uncharacterized protein n=2 Tax=Pseudonocardia TaxID=1847 RepID=A0A1Y2MH70_PSEAH|nr:MULTISPECIES: DUF6153 family protein [Pseudonocardia]OSY34624.1 hypothetical protein BG845_06670 [Pseudonocardia autotrophica]TDN75391.1 hypothetical protein C8E95_4547 [Pseudonocardia autotrophica]
MSDRRYGLQLVLLVLPVLLGLVGMHALVVPAAAPAPDTGHQVAVAASVAGPTDHRADAASAPPSAPVAAAADHDPMPADHGEHDAHLLHLCLAVLAAAGLALLAAWLFLGRLTLPVSVTPARQLAHGMPAQRPPPVPRRLAQLCVMRT